MDLFFIGPPILLPDASKLTSLIVNENDPIELNCPVLKTSDLSIQWSKNNEELDSLWSTSNLLIRRFMLKIPRAHSTDAGLYTCNVVNGFGHVDASFQVYVRCTFFVFWLKRNFLKSFVFSKSNDLEHDDQFTKWWFWFTWKSRCWWWWELFLWI